LDSLKAYSEPYSRLINNDREPNLEIRSNLTLINKLQVNVVYPFLMQVYKDYLDNEINADTFSKVLELIQSYVWRRFIVSLPTNALNKIFMDLYIYVDKNDYIASIENALLAKKVSGRFPSNDEVFKELASKDMYNIQPKNRSYFLERLENAGYKEKFFIEGNSDYSIEHIFPQTPSREWEENLGEDFKEMKILVNTCANLTLSVFNKELSNYPFIKKRNLPEKGYSSSQLRLNSMLKAFEEWNLISYTNRLNWIKDRFAQIWKYPLRDFMVLNDELDELDILDLLPKDVTGHKIEYFIFFGEKYENPTWQLLLKTVASIMFEREPHMFLLTNLREILKLTHNPEELLSPLQISGTYYIESNLGSQFIAVKVQKILEKCETDDELIIKLK